MTLLEEFIFSLNKSEREKLRPLQFRGAKRSIFFKILDCRVREGIDSSAVIKKHKLDKKRYYQMLSDMLSDCYYDLISEDGTALLLFLGNKQLFRHFYNEMKKQESELLKKNNPHDLEEYYSRVLIKRNLFLLHRKFNEDLVKELDAYAERYIEVKKSHPHDILYLKIIEINKQSENPFQGVQMEDLTATVAELEEIFNEVKQGDHILAQFSASDTLLMLLSRFHFEGKSPKPYAEFGIHLINEHPEIFASIKEFYELECLQFLNADEGNTLEQMKKYLTESFSRSGSSLYYIGRFFSKIIRSGDYEWGKKFIEKFFPYNIDLLRSDVALHYWYILTMYHVHGGNYSDGEKCLHKAFSANTGKNRNVNSDIILRCYDVFFVGMHGDPLMLENTVNKQLRYTSQHGYKKGETYQIFFLKAINDLTKCIGFDSVKAGKIRQSFMETPGAERLSFLFDKVFQKYFSADF
jgi:hypothetical protein